MPRSSADVLDSTTRDFHISDDGYDWGPVDWPAPVRGDDRSNVYAIQPGVRPRTGLFDAYEFLRHEPDAPMVHHAPAPHVIVADAAGFVSLADAGMLHEAARFLDAGMFHDAGDFGEAGDLQSNIRQWEADAINLLRRSGANITPADVNRIKTAFYGISQNAHTPRSWQAASDAHKLIWQIWNERLKRRPSADYEAQLTRHMSAIGNQTAGGKGVLAAIGSAVVSVGSGIAHAAKDVAKVAAPLLSVVKAIAPFAQTALSFVPGVGTVVNGAIAAGSALAQGKSITQALIDTAAASIPGGPIAKQAFNTGLAIVKGQNVTTAALDAVRNQIPGGLAGKAAFDTAVALAHGQSVQKAALSGVSKAAQSAVSSVANLARSQSMSVLDHLSPFSTRALSSVGPRLLGAASQALPSILPTPVKMVAQAVLNRPELRSVPIAELARRMNVTEHDARAGIASVVQSVARAGGSTVPRLAPAQAIADRLPGRASFDQALAAFASKARPPVFTHNALRRLGARGFLDAGGFVDAGALPPTIQQGSSGAAVQQWQQIIGVTADGKFGPQTKAATVAWQRSRGLVADGIVGPKTWSAALGAPAPAAAPAVPLPSMTSLPALPGPAAAPAPVVVATLANQLPQLKLGSTGPAVVKWQQIIRVAADGKFGPQTQAATKAWQASRGLVADGIVGPKTWAAAMTPAAAPSTPASVPMALPPIMQPVSLPPIPDFQAPPPPIAQPIPTVPIDLPPSVTTFPIPPFPAPGGTPPFIPGQVSTVMTPEGPVVGTTDRTGREVTVTQPPITSSAPSSGPGAVGALLILGTLIMVGSSGKRGLL